MPETTFHFVICALLLKQGYFNKKFKINQIIGYVLGSKEKCFFKY